MGSPRHIIADSGADDRPAQVGRVAAVFGEPYEAGGKTLIPVSQVRHLETGWTSKNGSAGFLLFGSPPPSAKPMAVIEVDQDQVRIVSKSDPWPTITAGVIVSMWNIYWILRTIREWRASP